MYGTQIVIFTINNKYKSTIHHADILKLIIKNILMKKMFLKINKYMIIKKDRNKIQV